MALSPAKMAEFTAICKKACFFLYYFFTATTSGDFDRAHVRAAAFDSITVHLFNDNCLSIYRYKNISMSTGLLHTDKYFFLEVFLENEN